MCYLESRYLDRTCDGTVIMACRLDRGNIRLLDHVKILHLMLTSNHCQRFNVEPVSVNKRSALLTLLSQQSLLRLNCNIDI